MNKINFLNMNLDLNNIFNIEFVPE